jgi:hypothetical protein
MNNPVSSKPEHALFPYPPGCTGHRIFEMLKSRVPDVTRHDYLDRFERRNLVPYKVYDKKMAREHAAKIEHELFGSGRSVVLFGADVAGAFGHPRLLLHPQVIGGVTWRQVPHPSGRNLWFNLPTNRDLVAMLLEELYRG